MEFFDHTGYHRRSWAETTMFRFKIIFGNTLSARLSRTSITEARIKGAALNRLTRLGTPDRAIKAKSSKFLSSQQATVHFGISPCGADFAEHKSQQAEGYETLFMNQVA